MMVYVYLLLVGFAGAFLQSSIGFGSALLMMNFLPLFFPSAQAFIVCQTTCICLAFSVLVKYHRYIRKDIIIPLLIPAAFFTVITTILTVNLDSEKIKVFLGVCFIILSLYFSFFAGKIKFKPTKKTAFAVGMISGFMNGAFSVGGPPAVLYLAPSLDNKNEYLGTSQAYFMCINTCSLAVRLVSVPLSGSVAVQTASCIAGAILGVLASLKVGEKLNAMVIKRLVYIVIGINGLLLIINNI